MHCGGAGGSELSELLSKNELDWVDAAASSDLCLFNEQLLVMTVLLSSSCGYRLLLLSLGVG
jgi:hypothetical protein